MMAMAGRPITACLVVHLAVALLASASNAAPSADVHSLAWFVHVDMIDASAGRDLSYYEQLLNDRLAQSEVILQGHQGPADNGCCVELEAVSVSTFGAPGDGLDVVMNASEFAAVEAHGPGAYLIEILQYCAGSVSIGIKGCANQPGNFLVVSLEADDTGFLPTLIAHERGHSAGLSHTFSPKCGLMNASNGGGCMTVSQCNSYRAKGDAVGASCPCLPDSVGAPPAPLGSSCGPSDVCSEGLCGHIGTLAGAVLVTSAGPGSSSGSAPETLLEQSAATGGWSPVGSGNAEISGLAYDAENDVLYGIEVLAGDDALVTVDPSTGEVLSTIGTLAGRSNTTALAFDARPSGDRLLAIHVDDDFFGQSCASISTTPPCVSELFEIDPTNASTTRLGELQALVIKDGVTGLAWDETNGLLYASTLAGIDRIDLATCTGYVCSNEQLEHTFREESALTWDPGTQQLVREGDNGYGVTRIDIVEPTTGALVSTIGLDVFTAGGLAVRAVPEPGGAAGLLAGALFLTLADRRRRRF